MRSAAAGDRAAGSAQPGRAVLAWSRRARWLAAVTVATMLWLLASASPASAHAVFVSATPAPGASLARPPATLRIVFSEPLVPKLSGVELESSPGGPVRPRSAEVDPHDSSAYELALPQLRPGHYTVIWHTTSQIDGHFRAGSYTFTVLEPGGAAPPGGLAPPGAAGLPAGPAQLPVPVQAATSWAGLAGLFLVTGAVLMLLLGGLARDATRRMFGWLLALAGLATAIGILDQFAATWVPTGWQAAALASVLGSGVATWLWLRLCAMAVALLAWPWRGRDGGPARLIVLGAATLAMVMSFAATGHDAASARPAAGLAFISVHVLAASVWLGGALCLVIVWGLARRHGMGAAQRRVLLRRFSLVAGMAVPAVAASGAASALLVLGSITDFVRSVYGITLLAKLAVAAAVAAAAVSTVLAHRHAAGTEPPGEGRLRNRMWAEAGLGLLILVPTAIMSVLGPPGPADAARQAGQELATGIDPADAFTASSALGPRGLELSLTPGTSGTNAVRIEVDGRYPAAQLRAVLTRAGAPVLGTMHHAGYDHDPQTHTIYQGTVTLPAAGTWTAVVRGPAAASPPITLPLRVAPAGAQSAPSSPWLDGWLLAIAVLGSAGVAVGAARWVPGRRWRGATFAFGGASGAAALVGITVLSVAAQSSAAAAIASPWGTASAAPRTAADGATTWPVGAGDAALMMPDIAPDGTVWVGEMDANKLARLTPDGNVVQQFRLPGGYKEVMGLTVDSDNHVWVAEEHAQALGMFDPATGRYRQYPIPGHDPAPVGIAAGASGQVWFTMMNGNAIGRLDPDTGRITQYRIPSAHALPYWLATGRHGDVWFAEFGAGKLGVLDPATGRIRQFALAHGSSPAGIAVAPSGSVWATTTQGLLIRLDARSGRMRTFRAPVANEYGVAVARNGTVWLGVESGSAVYSFSPASGAFARHPVPAKRNPWWVTTSQGQVWVALGSDIQGGLTELGGVS